nr:MAG TPA: hypothetical protein [Caudoviricetes sp.]
MSRKNFTFFKKYYKILKMKGVYYGFWRNIKRN